MFLKQYNYKPRTGSMSSQSGSEQPASAATAQTGTTQAANTTAPTTDAQAGRRRSSTDQKYSGLHGYKRSSMDDKRSSYADQSPGQPGVLGQMWSNFTKGNK